MEVMYYTCNKMVPRPTQVNKQSLYSAPSVIITYFLITIQLTFCKNFTSSITQSVGCFFSVISMKFSAVQNLWADFDRSFWYISCVVRISKYFFEKQKLTLECNNMSVQCIKFDCNFLIQTFWIIGAELKSASENFKRSKKLLFNVI